MTMILRAAATVAGMALLYGVVHLVLTDGKRARDRRMVRARREAVKGGKP